MVLSELCTVFPVPPSDDEVGRPDRLRVVVEAEEDSCEYVPWGEKGLEVESGEASGDLDGIEPGLAAWRGARSTGVGEGEAMVIPASRGLLLEFIWPRLDVPAASRHRKSTKSNPGLSEQSAGPHPREVLVDGKATTCSTASDGNGGQTRVTCLPQRPPSDSSASWSTEGRLGHSHPRYFLVLTLAFLRALVEKHSRCDNELRAGDAGRLDGVQPTAEHARPCLADALSRVPILEAKSGLHGRLIDEIPPALYQTLATIVDQALLPPPDILSPSEDDVGSEGGGKRWSLRHSQLGAFFGSAVRGVLESRGKRTDTADYCSGGGVDSDGNASGERLCHFEPTRAPGVQLPPDHDLGALSPVSSKRYVPEPPRGRCNARSVRAAEDSSNNADSSLVAGLCSASANTGNRSHIGAIPVGNGLLLEQRENTVAPRKVLARNSVADSASASCLECCDVSVLAKMQRVNSHAAFPGLAEDARMFAKVLSGLAEHGGM